MIVNLEAPGIIDDGKLQRVARAIAMDIDELDTILRNESLSPEQMQSILGMDYFRKLLAQEQAAWNAIENTEDRIRFKSLAIVEQSLDEFYARMHDKDESLLHKTDALKTIAKFAGVGVTIDGGSAERFSVTINLGADHTMKLNAAIPTIEHESE